MDWGHRRIRSLLTYRITVTWLVCCSGCATIRKYTPTDHGMRRSRQLTQEAQTLVHTEQWEEAEAKLLEAVERCSANDQARRCLSDVLWNRGANLPAIEQLTKAMELSGRRDPPTLIRIGTMHFAEGRLSEALELAKEALQHDPHLADGWALRGMVESAQGDFDTALSSFYRSLSEASDNLRTRMEIARIYRARNEPNRALAVLNAPHHNSHSVNREDGTSSHMTQELAELHHLMGTIYRDLGRHTEAVDSLAKAYEAGDTRAELLQWLAESQLALGDFNAARHTLDQIPAPQRTSTMSELYEQILIADRSSGYSR